MTHSRPGEAVNRRIDLIRWFVSCAEKIDGGIVKTFKFTAATAFVLLSLCAYMTFTLMRGGRPVALAVLAALSSAGMVFYGVYKIRFMKKRLGDILSKMSEKRLPCKYRPPSVDYPLFTGEWHHKKEGKTGFRKDNIF